MIIFIQKCFRIGSPYNDSTKFNLLCPDNDSEDDYVMQGLLLSSEV